MNPYGETTDVEFDGGVIRIFKKVLYGYVIPNNGVLRGDHTYCEADTVRLLVNRIRPHWTFMDIGAHVGVYSFIMASRCRRVLAFEPIPAVYDLLKWNTRGFDNVETFRLGISDKTREGAMAFGPQPGNGAIVAAGGQGNIDSVEIVTIDSLNLFANVIKIDTESHERQVIAGGTDTIGAAQLVIAEHHGDRGIARPLADMGFHTMEYNHRVIAVKDAALIEGL